MVQQGDHLGPFGFALTLQPIIDRIQSEVPDLASNVWYLDDGTLVDTAKDLPSTLTIIKQEGPKIGLVLNKAKSLLFIPPMATSLLNLFPSAIPTVRHGFPLLGCPVVPLYFSELRTMQ